MDLPTNLENITQTVTKMMFDIHGLVNGLMDTLMVAE